MPCNADTRMEYQNFRQPSTLSGDKVDNLPGDGEVRKMDDDHDYRYNALRDAWEAESSDKPSTPRLDRSKQPRHNEVRRIGSELKRYNGARKAWEQI